MAVAVHCVNMCVCVCTCMCAEMLSNRWSNLILVSCLPCCPPMMLSGLYQHAVRFVPGISSSHHAPPTLTCLDTSIYPDTHWSSKGSLSRWSCSQFTWDGVLGERTVSGNKSAAPPVSRLCTKLMETNPVGRFSACRNPQSRVFLTVLSFLLGKALIASCQSCQLVKI